jgi:tRNA modification GTPase
MSPVQEDIIAAIATAPGRGAVGIVRVSGKDLQAWVQQLLGRVIRPREATYLPFRDADGTAIDHGLALYFPGPNSFTGEDVLELQAHGGPVVMQMLLSRCLGLAMPGKPPPRLARPGEFTERAFLNNKIDLAQAEAIADLIDASTVAAAKSASRSLAGEFSTEIHGLRDQLIHLRMLVEATLDFPEEEIDFLQKADAQGQLTRLQARLDEVLACAQQGVLLREGIKVVIAGQPNAGKSSLLNALAGAELAIVTPIEGTTRDKVQQTIQIEGVPVHVIDTAGLRASTDVVEKIGIERAWAEIIQADVVLFLHDLSRAKQTSYLAGDQGIGQKLVHHLPSGVPVVDVWNKSDLAVGELSPAGLTLSTKTGEGLPALRQKLLDLAGWQSNPEGVYIARERHVQALQQVAAHVQMAAQHLQSKAQSLDLLAEELRLAQQALNSITGEFTSDDLLGVIFSSFCIGK